MRRDHNVVFSIFKPKGLGDVYAPTSGSPSEASCHDEWREGKGYRLQHQDQYAPIHCAPY